MSGTPVHARESNSYNPRVLAGNITAVGAAKGGAASTGGGQLSSSNNNHIIANQRRGMPNKLRAEVNSSTKFAYQALNNQN